MNELHYAYAVARVRCLETKLLTKQDLQQLVAAPDLEQALTYLNSKGWAIDRGDYIAASSGLTDEAWRLVMSLITEDKGILDSYLVFNDFHNLKAAVKAKFTGVDAKGLMVAPSVISADKIIAAVNEHDFSSLPGYMIEPTEKAYEYAMQAHNGQRSDIELDRGAMKAAVLLADKTGVRLLSDVARLRCDCADAKTAVRAVQTKKNEEFLDAAIGGYGKLDKSELISAALDGLDKVGSVLTSSGYDALASALNGEANEFEKSCDNALMDLLRPEKYNSFGIGPLLSYCVALETEVTNIKVILSCKHNGLSNDEIERRLRDLYV